MARFDKVNLSVNLEKFVDPRADAVAWAVMWLSDDLKFMHFTKEDEAKRCQQHMTTLSGSEWALVHHKGDGDDMPKEYMTVEPVGGWPEYVS